MWLYIRAQEEANTLVAGTWGGRDKMVAATCEGVDSAVRDRANV